MLPFIRGRLASEMMSTLPFAVTPLAAVLSTVANEGERRFLLKYDVDDTERGSAGRWDAAGERGAWSM